jgi:superfamily I DNA and/or RNA helicase
MVILLLGGDPKKTGAINWAASAPNILNVGITRAKNLIFVVGNHDLWSEKPYFQDLSIAINKTTIEKILDLDYAE